MQGNWNAEIFSSEIPDIHVATHQPIASLVTVLVVTTARSDCSKLTLKNAGEGGENNTGSDLEPRRD